MEKVSQILYGRVAEEATLSKPILAKSDMSINMDQQKLLQLKAQLRAMKDFIDAHSSKISFVSVE